MKKYLSKALFKSKVFFELNRIKSYIHFPEKKPISGIWAITMVRNESGTLPVIIEHFLKQGISRILVVNHLSTDETVESMSYFGDFTQIAQYNHPSYEQRAVMTLAARYAAECGASWIIPFDADELWWPTSEKTIAGLLNACKDDKIPAPHYDFLPPDELLEKFSPESFFLHRNEPNPMPKTAFRAHPKAIVSMGNHWVHRPGTSGVGLVIAHYPYRSKNQLLKKAREGSVAINALQNSKELGSHWQQWSKMNDEEFDKFWKSLQSSSDVVQDPELRSLRTVNSMS